MEAIERYSISNDLLTIVILLVLLLLVVARSLFQNRFEDFTSLLTSAKYLVIKSKEHKSLFGFNVLMLMVHILSISLFLFVLYRSFFSPEMENSAIVFLQITTGYSFFILLKITVEKIIANVFDVDQAIDHYLFQKHTFRNFISLILFPVTIFLAYANNPKEGMFYTVIGLFLAATVYTFFRTVKKNQGLVSRYWFYFILYLCALEITPYIILFKLIRTS